MDARTKICAFCRKEIHSNPVAVTAANGRTRWFHYDCSDIDRSKRKPARVIKLGDYKK